MKLKWQAPLLAAVAGIILAGCNSGSEQPAPPAQPSTPSTNAVLPSSGEKAPAAAPAAEAVKTGEASPSPANG